MNLAKLAEAVKEVQEDSVKRQLQDLLAHLRAQHWMYHTAHWQSSGPMAYERHLLFERFYSALPDQYDGLAEKMVQLYDKDSVDPVQTMIKSTECLKRWVDGTDAVESGLRSEHELQTAIKKLCGEPVTLGMNNFLQGIADAHETHLYLLGQLRRG